MPIGAVFSCKNGPELIIMPNTRKFTAGPLFARILRYGGGLLSIVSTIIEEVVVVVIHGVVAATGKVKIERVVLAPVARG